jgi:hypothetical protein
MEIRKTETLYCKYQTQLQQQPCFVELDCEREVLSADYSSEIGGGVPSSVWHGRTLRWRIPSLFPRVADGLLADIAPLAERVLAGYESRWDGSNNVGKLDAGATEASAEIEALCEAAFGDAELIECAWDAEEWATAGRSTRETLRSLAAQFGVTHDLTREQWDEVEHKIVNEAKDANVMLENVTSFVESMVAAMQE